MLNRLKMLNSKYQIGPSCILFIVVLINIFLGECILNRLIHKLKKVSIEEVHQSYL